MNSVALDDNALTAVRDYITIFCLEHGLMEDDVVTMLEQLAGVFLGNAQAYRSAIN